jgi:hypothetical protein
MIPKRRRNRSEVARNRNLRHKENRIGKGDGEEEGFHQVSLCSEVGRADVRPVTKFVSSVAFKMKTLAECENGLSFVVGEQ